MGRRAGGHTPSEMDSFVARGPGRRNETMVDVGGQEPKFFHSGRPQTFKDTRGGCQGPRDDSMADGGGGSRSWTQRAALQYRRWGGSGSGTQNRIDCRKRFGTNCGHSRLSFWHATPDLRTGKRVGHMLFVFGTGSHDTTMVGTPAEPCKPVLWNCGRESLSEWFQVLNA